MVDRTSGFTWDLGDGRAADCLPGETIEYGNCTFDAGLSCGLGVDTFYVRIRREGEEPLMLFMRPDEIAALAHCLSGAMWTAEMFERFPTAEREEAGR